MLSKSELPGREVSLPLHGSSLAGHGDALDGERAASMADEGGAAGAEMDAVEQESGVRLVPRGAAGTRSFWLVGAIAAGAALFAAALFWRSR
jgi:hypothetical protein